MNRLSKTVQEYITNLSKPVKDIQTELSELTDPEAWSYPSSDHTAKRQIEMILNLVKDDPAAHAQSAAEVFRNQEEGFYTNSLMGVFQVLDYLLTLPLEIEDSSIFDIKVLDQAISEFTKFIKEEILRPIFKRFYEQTDEGLKAANQLIKSFIIECCRDGRGLAVHEKPIDDLTVDTTAEIMFEKVKLD